MKRNRLRPISSRLGCFVARKVIEHFQCERIVEVAGRLGFSIDYQPVSPFTLSEKGIVISRLIPRRKVIQIFGDQLFRYQMQLKQRNIHVDYYHLVYHAIACEIGHHLWNRFLKEAFDGSHDWDANWQSFEGWLKRTVSLSYRCNEIPQ